MQSLVSVLEQSIPLIIIVSLTVLMSLETIIPYFKHSPARKKQRWHNLANIAFSFVLNAALSTLVSFNITTGTEMQFGLLWIIPIPNLLSVLIGIMLCDLNGYVAHRLYHTIPLFWKFHVVHHSDIELDASSALRLHPFEFIFQAITQATVLPLLGVTNVSFVFYSAFALLLFIVNHSNLRYPRWYEHYVSLIFVTPNWHRVHHSSYQPDTDSNFADVFTLWDRIFRTSRHRNPEEITFGLEDMRDTQSQTFWALMKAPFQKRRIRN